MKLVLGVAAFALAMAAIFIPQHGLYASSAALILASVAAFAGEKVFSSMTPAVAAVNLFFFSPHAVAMINKSKDVLLLWFLVVVVLALPYIALALKASGAFDFSERVKHH